MIYFHQDLRKGLVNWLGFPNQQAVYKTRHEIRDRLHAQYAKCLYIATKGKKAFCVLGVDIFAQLIEKQYSFNQQEPVQYIVA